MPNPFITPPQKDASYVDYYAHYDRDFEKR
jgi:hypothetical protein